MILMQLFQLHETEQKTKKNTEQVPNRMIGVFSVKASFTQPTRRGESLVKISASGSGGPRIQF